MNLLAAIFFASGAALSVYGIATFTNAFLDGWEERRDARRRNQATRL